MTYDQLNIFITVVDSGGFQSAAKKLNISQPSISRAVKQLEEEFGFLLFHRDSYRPKLSKRGEVFYEHTRNTLKSMKRLQNVGQILGAGEEQKLSIVLGDIAPFSLTLQIIKEFFAKHNTCQLNLLCEGVFGPSERVWNDEADFGISSLPFELYENTYRIELMRVDLIPVVSWEHPLAKMKHITDEMLAEFMQVIVRDTSKQSQNISFGISDVQQMKCMVADQEMKLKIISAGLGWGRVPGFLASHALKVGELKQLDLLDTQISSPTIYVYYKKDKLLGPNGKRFWRFMQENSDKFV